MFCQITVAHDEMNRHRLAAKEKLRAKITDVLERALDWDGTFSADICLSGMVDTGQGEFTGGYTVSITVRPHRRP